MMLTHQRVLEIIAGREHVVDVLREYSGEVVLLVIADPGKPGVGLPRLPHVSPTRYVGGGQRFDRPAEGPDGHAGSFGDSEPAHLRVNMAGCGKEGRQTNQSRRGGSQTTRLVEGIR